MLRNCQPLVQPQSWMTTPCRLSATAYSIHSQLPSTCGGRLIHPQHKNASCRDDRDPFITLRLQNFFLKIFPFLKYPPCNASGQFLVQHFWLWPWAYWDNIIIDERVVKFGSVRVLLLTQSQIMIPDHDQFLTEGVCLASDGVKVNAAPWYACAGTEGRRKYSSNPFATSVLEGGGWLSPHPGRSTPVKDDLTVTEHKTHPSCLRLQANTRSKPPNRLKPSVSFSFHLSRQRVC